MVQLHGGAGPCRLALGPGLFHLVRRAQTGKRHLGFQDAGAHLHHAVAPGAGKHGGQLVQVGNDHLLPRLGVLQRHILLFGLRAALGAGKQLFGVFAGDLAGADGALGGAGLLVLLDAAQLVG